MKILLIDSDSTERRKWAGGLEAYSAEYEVVKAHNGRLGLDLNMSRQFDCVILELNLPDRTGLSVLLNLVERPQHPRIPVVVLTNFVLYALYPLAIRNGARSCLEKDHTSIEQLDQAIRKAIAAVGPNKNRNPS
ncbi:MAG TPA: response regulator [Nitrospira sp.]|nr:response regulator [Nitrospira sp.]